MMAENEYPTYELILPEGIELEEIPPDEVIIIVEKRGRREQLE